MTFKILALWTFILIGRPQDIFAAVAVMRPALVVGVATQLMAFSQITEARITSVLQIPEVRKYLLFYLIMLMGIPFAYHRRVAFEYSVTLYSISVMFFLVFVLVVNTMKQFQSMILVVCGGALTYGIFVLSTGAVAEGRLMPSGNMYDPNDIAYVMVSLLPLGFFYILHCSKGMVKALIAGASICVSTVVILASGSRGGLVSLSALVLLLVMAKGQIIRWRWKFALLAAIVVIGLLNLDRINVDRLQTVSDIGSDYNATDEFGRIEIWKKGVDIFLTYPLTGVGANCFAMAIGFMRQDLNLIPAWQEAHNSYLQVAAEMGLPGIIVLLLLIAVCYRNFKVCQRLPDSSRSSRELQELKTIAWTLQVGFTAHLVAAFFLTQGYSILFVLYFGFSAVLRQLASDIARENGAQVGNGNTFSHIIKPVYVNGPSHGSARE